MGPTLRRRDALRVALASMAAPIGIGLTPPPARGFRSFRLVEPSGLRRFGFPVGTVVPDAGDGLHFRLMRDGRAIPAQFRLVDGEGGRRDVMLDFVASPGPLESARYEVHFGLEVEPGPEPKSGLAVEKRDGRFYIAQGSSMSYELSEDLTGFLRSVGSPRLGYVRDPGGGLLILEKDGPAIPGSISGLHSRIIREGPMAVALRFEGTSGPSGIVSKIDLTIPASKSWVQVSWSVEDPRNRLAGIGLDAPLVVESLPTLVDLGAGSTIYGQLRGSQRMELESGRAIVENKPVPTPRWVVRLGEGENPPILAASTPAASRSAEGWSHVMDSKRCTALAVADFGQVDGRDRISIGADGSLRFLREFREIARETRGTTMSLKFWLHFVPMPVQVGAATSPQSILSPLLVEWDRPPA